MFAVRTSGEAGVPDQLLDLAIMVRPDADAAERELVARLAGRLGYFAVHVAASVPLSTQELEQLMAAAEPAMVVIDEAADVLGVVRVNDPELVQRVRMDLDQLEDHRPLIVAVPLSIGRTYSEAMARADREPRFVGDADPRVSGIFGTFEQAQEQVLALARAGAEVLLVTLPHELDIADLMAQVKALVVGATPALRDRPHP